MKVQRANKPSAGITLAEVLIVVICLAVLVVVLLPAFPGGSKKAPRVRCTAQLKQVALGFALWANEHQGKLPMEVPVSAGGSKEDALAGRIVPSFTVAAREIWDPRVLVCPSDKRRQQTSTFANLTTDNISYFLNADAAWVNQSHIIAGDRQVTTNGSTAREGLLPIRDPSAVDWGKPIHGGGGNVALVDGSVHQVTKGQLWKLLETGVTNRLIIP